MFESQGLDGPALFRCAQLPYPTSANGPRYATDALSTLWELAVGARCDPALGIEPGLPERCVNFDLPGLFVLTSADLRHGLRSLAGYLSFISDAAMFDLWPQQRDAWLVLGHIGNDRSVPRQRKEYGLLSLLALCRWCLRRPVIPLAVESHYPPPAQPARYAAAFGVAPRFGAEHTRLLLSAADLDQPLPAHDIQLHALHRRVLDDRLAALGTSALVRRVKSALAARLAQGEPRRADIAVAMAMSEHTLQRRLDREGLSFSMLLDDTRRELARSCLTDPSLSIDGIAAQLGFRDCSNFYRACRRWFGQAPQAVRREQAAKQHRPAASATAAARWPSR